MERWLFWEGRGIIGQIFVAGSTCLLCYKCKFTVSHLIRFCKKTWITFLNQNVTMTKWAGLTAWAITITDNKFSLVQQYKWTTIKIQLLGFIISVLYGSYSILIIIIMIIIISLWWWCQTFSLCWYIVQCSTNFIVIFLDFHSTKQGLPLVDSYRLRYIIKQCTPLGLHYSTWSKHGGKWFDRRWEKHCQSFFHEWTQHQDSRENKTNCFPRDLTLHVYYSQQQTSQKTLL